MEEVDLIKPLENINIAEVCRACFETCEQYKILFDEAECIDKRTLGDVFFDVVKIEMKANAETPPSRICLTCSNDLIAAYNFIQKSQKNNLRLLQYLQNANIKKPDCLTEFPIDIPNDQNITNFLQIKVENEAIHDYDYNDSIPDDADDRNSAGLNYDSDESDYEPLINKKEKIKKLECTYCNRIFKRHDFFENHMKKHKDEVVKKKEVEDEESQDGANFKCEECDFSCDLKPEMKRHTKAKHFQSFSKKLNSPVRLESEINECAIIEERPSSSKNLFILKEASIQDDTPLSCSLSNEAKKSTELTISKLTSNFVTEKETNMCGEGEATVGTEAEDKKCGQRSSSKRMPYQKILFDQKKSLVKLYDEGKTIKEAAALTNINLNTAKGILRNYKKRKDLLEKRRGGRARKLTNDVLTTIEACFEKHPGTHLEDIRKILAQQKVHVSRSTIRNGLRKLKITLNMPSYNVENVNMPQTIERRRIFALEFSNWDLHDRHKIIFIDECVFSLQWEKVQKPNSNYVQGRKAVVIAAMNSNGIIHWNVLGKASCNTTDFAAFVRELVDKISTQEELSGAVLIMDSAGIHSSREVGEILAASKFCIRTLPPFSQMLNPLAKSFVKMKAYARSLLNESNIAQSNLVEVMETSVEKVTPTDCSNYVMDVVLLLHDAIAGRAFECGN